MERIARDEALLHVDTIPTKNSPRSQFALVDKEIPAARRKVEAAIAGKEKKKWLAGIAKTWKKTSASTGPTSCTSTLDELRHEHMASRRLVFVGALVCPWLFAVACGSRTGLLAPEETDAQIDVHVHDAGHDVFDATEEDALPSIDAFPDVPIPTDCPDAGATLVYVITAQNELFSFYPPTLAFSKIGTVACPGTSTPFSMAVNRLGIAYSVFADGNLFQVSTANAACKATTFTPGQQGFQTFGMGYAGAADGGDTLYVAEGHYTGDSKGLGTIDTKSFNLSLIGAFNPALTQCELTGTGDGRLFAYCLPAGTLGSQLAEINPTNAKVIASNALKVGAPNDAFAFAFWGGDFWIFTAPGGASTVTQYNPATKSETAVTKLPSTIVGAGVSTCAPQ